MSQRGSPSSDALRDHTVTHVNGNMSMFMHFNAIYSFKYNNDYNYDNEYSKTTTILESQLCFM